MQRFLCPVIDYGHGELSEDWRGERTNALLVPSNRIARQDANELQLRTLIGLCQCQQAIIRSKAHTHTQAVWALPCLLLSTGLPLAGKRKAKRETIRVVEWREIFIV